MRKKFVSATAILFAIAAAMVLTSPAHAEYEEKPSSGFLVGVLGGIDYATGTDEYRDDFDLMWGACGKFFFSKVVGVGVTYFNATHSDKGGYESKISGIIADLMIRLGKQDRVRQYASLSLGSATEDYSYGSSNSTLIGIGVGSMRVLSGNFALGGDVRYLVTPDAWNASGRFQAMLILGFGRR